MIIDCRGGVSPPDFGRDEEIVLQSLGGLPPSIRSSLLYLLRRTLLASRVSVVPNRLREQKRGVPSRRQSVGKLTNLFFDLLLESS